ncbi:hypothetical protein QQZ08_001138 [Neonectria magnoliae]|uniref:Uncharacterized protein n=1 Tax=Neonectria magnoliae TaxID=2732573 RepID=A0ABR1IEX6_9HYPO
MADVTGLYGGKGGMVFSEQPSPPPYDQTKPQPPIALSKNDVKPSSATTLGKRSIRTALGREVIESICIQVFEERSAKQTERFQKELKTLKRELLERIDKRFTELDVSSTYSKDKVDELMERNRGENEDWVEMKIDERLLDAKVEMREEVESELEDAEERLLQRLGSAKWVLDRSSAE